MPLKKYIIVGSLILFLSSLFAYYLHDFGLISLESNLDCKCFLYWRNYRKHNIFLGLGHKQKMILQDKNNSQKKLIIPT